MSICVCVNRTIDGDLRWCLMEAVSGQTGITVSCILHIIQVYLKKNTIRKLLLERRKKIQSLNVIDQIIIFIYSWLVSKVTELIN